MDDPIGQTPTCQWHNGHSSSVCLRPQAETVTLPDGSVKRLCELHARRLLCRT
jgi:hypothetical protein